MAIAAQVDTFARAAAQHELPAPSLAAAGISLTTTSTA